MAYAVLCCAVLCCALLLQTIQLLQMLAGIMVTAAWTYLHFTSNAAAGIRLPELAPVLIAASVGMYASYFVLFAMFYIQRYCKARDAAAAKKRAVANGTGNATYCNTNTHTHTHLLTLSHCSVHVLLQLPPALLLRRRTSNEEVRRS